MSVADELFRVYWEHGPDEFGYVPADGYPRQWRGPNRLVEVGHERYWTTLGPPRYTDPEEATVTEFGGIKDIVREEAGHRCIRCGHPYMKGMGQWSPCDEVCTHAGPIRLREAALGDEAPWSEHLLPGTEAHETRIDEGPHGPMVRYDVEAQWRILTVHHLNGVKIDCRWWNLVALCQRCHLTIQGKVHMQRPWRREHSEWFKPYVAAFYAYEKLGEELTREQTMARLDELLALEDVQGTLDGF